MAKVAEWQPRPPIRPSGGPGAAQLWHHILGHRRRLTATGAFAAQWRTQQAKWMWRYWRTDGAGGSPPT